MAITEVKNKVHTNSSMVQFICPVCKSKKSLEIPNSVIEEAKQLTTMSIAKGLVCEHQFQAFVDKDFQVRGYQRVDFELENRLNENKSSNPIILKQNDNELFENLILEENYLEYRPKQSKKKKEESQKAPLKRKIMTLEEIYCEFREFIDEDNEKFKDFIEKDLTRNQIIPTY
ncbi:MAG: hypothetical protein ACFE9I_13745 [Candidatus Hermodarchaeota archaeon]